MITATAVARVASGADADSLSGRIVRHVDLVTHTIFDPLPDRGRSFYRFANRLHVRTRPGTLRAALVVREGERWSEAARQESERNLRALTFIVPDSVEASPVGEDSVDVRVVTHDNWTTSPEFSVESGGGRNFGSVLFNERNFMGRGTSVGLGYREDITGTSRLVNVDDGQILGSHWHGRAAYGDGTAGTATDGLIELPFWAEATPRSAGVSWEREQQDVPLFSDDVQAATVREQRETGEMWLGLGHRDDAGVIRRLLLDGEVRNRREDAPALESGAPPTFAASPEDVRIRRLSLIGQLMRPHWIVKRGIEQLDRDEDFDVGRSLELKGGYSPRAFGSTLDESYARAILGLGADAGALGFGLVRAKVESRFVPEVREGYAEVDARWMQQPRRGMTAVLAAWGGAGRDMPADFQLTLGGVTGLRAFPVHDLTGTEAWRGNAELRWLFVNDWLRLVSLGAATFWDSGRTWGTGAESDAWHHDVGFGLRVSLPHSSLDMVARFDVAWAVAPEDEMHRGPGYSFGSGQAF